MKYEIIDNRKHKIKLEIIENGIFIMDLTDFDRDNWNFDSILIPFQDIDKYIEKLQIIKSGLKE